MKTNEQKCPVCQGRGWNTVWTFEPPRKLSCKACKGTGQRAEPSAQLAADGEPPARGVALGERRDLSPDRSPSGEALSGAPDEAKERSDGGGEGGCRCLEIIRGKLEKHHGEGSEVCLDLKTVIHMDTMQMGRALPPLYYSYKAGKKRKKSHITFNFCPFCGRASK